MGAAEKLYDIGRAGLDGAYEFARRVKEREIPACKYVRLAVDRYYRDLETGGERGLYFDEHAAARVFITFSYLRHVEGVLQGQPIILEPWQQFIIANVFGWMRENGLRRFRTVYEEIPRKNGKTIKLGGIGVHGLAKDNEPGAKVYSAATKKDQAKLLFDAAKNMIKQSPSLRRALQLYRNSIEDQKNFGCFEPLSADTKSLDGLNVHMGLVDEFHAHPTSEVWDVLKSALGSRLQPIMWAITTAGFNLDSACYKQRDYAIKVLEGLEDDSYFGIIFTIDEDDDPFDEVSWAKANPNLGVSVSLENLRDQARMAAVMPSEMVNFLTKNLNVWVAGGEKWMNMEAWNACAGDYTEDDLAGLPCWGGLDLASVSDICSLVLSFKCPDGKMRTVGRHYLPADSVRELQKKSGAPFSKWIGDEKIILTPGNVCDYNFIKRDIYELSEKYDIQEIAFDRWNSSQMVNDLLEEGVPMVGFGQGYGSMNPAMKDAERVVLGGEVEHNDPVLSWAISNVVAKTDEAGNIKPDKKKSTQKIDPAVAWIMAVGRSVIFQDGDFGPSIYETESF